MDFKSALIVAHAGAPSTAQLEQVAAQCDLRATIGSEKEVLEWARDVGEKEGAPVIVILGPDLTHPVGIGRGLRAMWADTHILFVQRQEGIEQFRKALSHAPMLGFHWSLSEDGDASLPHQVENAVAATRKRTKLRMTLDRANLKLAARTVADVDESRHMMSEHYLANFLAQAGESIIAADKNGRVLYWNASVLQLLGLDGTKLLGTELARLPFWSAELGSAVASVERAGTVRCELVYQYRDESMFLEVGCSAVYDRQQRLVGVTLVIRDTSERHRLLEVEREEHRMTGSMLIQLERMVEERTASLRNVEQALHQAQKLESLGKLTGGVAHDFNNILQVIGGNLDLLKEQFHGATTVRDRLEMAATAVERGAKLASQLLAFARKQPLKPLPTNLVRIVREMDGLLRRALGETIEIETVIGGGLWTAMVDRNHLENVILNLAINARDAMDGRGRLTIELGNALLDDHYAHTNADASAGQYVMLAISDTGGGMPPEVAAHAFEPFYTTKPEGQGTGLGLSMAYGFVKQSSGHIKIYSEPGIGTTIKVYLPRIHQVEAEVTDLRRLPTVGGKETILVVEDDPAVRTTVVDILSELGYVVLKASDGQGGLNVLQSGIPVDLLFTDVVMPGPVRSTDLARQARELHPGIEILFTSGYTQNAIVHGGRLDAGVELISKPYRREDLAKKIRSLLVVPGEPLNPPQEPKLQGANRVLPVLTGPKTILVVEDNDDARQMLCELLQALGYTALSAVSGEEALNRMREKHIDILLTDVGLPGMSGKELARQAIASDANLKIVFTSGYGVVEHLSFPSHSLPKPYKLQDLQVILESL
ncbi:response regulator [Massilia jejuensis]|uniref:histidine kinase n=1 Tax=Massilia jejuensis TaxID=648894 RepID=A0ABW0PLL5_9BURK